MRSSWKDIIPAGFLPPPAPFRQSSSGPVIPKKAAVKKTDLFLDLWRRLALSNIIPPSKYDELPYDYYCPSVNKIDARICKGCGIYYPSAAAVNRHRRGKGCGIVDSDEDFEEVADEVVIVDEVVDEEEDRAPIINIFELLANPAFVDDSGDEEEG